MNDDTESEHLDNDNYCGSMYAIFSYSKLLLSHSPGDAEVTSANA